MTYRSYRNALAIIGALCVLGAARVTHAQCCSGDCDGDGRVSIDELVRAVAIAVSELSLSSCDSLDRDANGFVTIDEVIAAVDQALAGEPSTATATPSATDTATQGPSPTPTPSFTATDTPIPGATSTPTPSPTSSFTSSPTPSITPTATRTFTPTRTPSSTPSATPSPTRTRTPTPTPMATDTPTGTPTSMPTSTPTVTPTHGFFVGGFGNLFGQPGSTTQLQVAVNAGGIASASIDYCFPTDVFDPTGLECQSCPFGDCTADTATVVLCDGSTCSESCDLPNGRRVRVGVENLSGTSSGATILSCQDLLIQTCALESPSSVACPAKSSASACFPVGVEATFTDAANVVFAESGQVSLQIFGGNPGDFCDADCKCLSGNCDEDNLLCQ